MDDATRAQVETDAIAGFERRAEEMAPLLRQVGAVLRLMFSVGAALMVLGLVLSIVRREPLADRVDPLQAIIPAILAGHASGVVDLAILWLMAAPVVATIVVLAGFLKMGDRRYAAVTGLVLAVLAVSILRALLK
ncbi:MAG: DUF1634 domain-containing protein [Thermomicrobiales bacterium]